ncbi:MAG: glutathione S-transferase family protein [Beijerinckiaceae bacterium]|nr:glutathione S-transferase family protein [Beijerinckiaceae bacterium]
MLTIWGRTNSLNVQKALMALEEAGIAYERFDAGLAFGVVNTPQYRQMNPNGLVPTIDDDGFVLWESNAIIRYVCARYAPALWPADAQARASAERWMDWQLTTLLDPVNDLFRPLIRRMWEPDPAELEKARAACARNFAVLDDVLSRQPFMTGAAFGMADCSIAPVAHRWLSLPVERPAAPHLEAWFARVRARPSARVLELPLS